jgi:AcrR family transcriptional regulator
MTSRSETDPGREVTDKRRDQMLAAAAVLIAERGFSETRIVDVARRVGASPALVIYYFGTKDSLLTEALRYSEESFYQSCAQMLAETTTLRERLENLVRMTCEPEEPDGSPSTWGLWFDLWAQAFRHPGVAEDRVQLERRWRNTIAQVVREGVAHGEIEPVDADDFAVTFGVMLDGLSIQVALRDEMVTPEHALRLAMEVAEHSLGLPQPSTTS